MLLRTLVLLVVSRFRPRLGFHDVGRLKRRVLPNDLDVLGHMNNGVYFSVMDLGRLELGVRSGAWRLFAKNGWYPVAGSETMTFRRSLQPWQRYVLESRVVGYDDRAMYMQQRFVVGGEVYAEGIVRGRFVRRPGSAGGGPSSASGTGVSGTGVSGTGMSGTAASGTGTAATGVSGTGTAATGASGTGGSGTVSMKEFGEVIGVDTAGMPVPEWMSRWAADVTLPPARASFRSDW